MARPQSRFVCQPAANPSSAGRASAAPAAPGTAWSRPSCASPSRADAGRRPRRRPPRPMSAGRHIGEADLPALQPGHRRARPRARRRARPGLARPPRRRAGDRQVHAPPPGRRGPGSRPAPAAARSSTPPARNRPGQVRLRAARLGLLDGPAGERVQVLAEHDVGRIVEVARATRPELVIVDSIQTATVDELDGAGRQRRPGPRVRRSA